MSSVRLKDVHVPAAHKGADGPLFKGLNLNIEEGARIGVLGAAKTGKSTLLRLVCGTARPNSGIIKRDARISWPIPLLTIFLADASVATNIRFVAHLYGVKDDRLPRRIGEMVEITEFLNVPLKECPRFVRPRLALALGINIDFDLYLFDGAFAACDREFKEKASSIVAEKMAGRSYVLAAATPTEAEGACNSIYVLEAGQARYFANAQEGIEHFKSFLTAERKKLKSAGELEKKSDEDEDDESVLGDVNILGSAIADVVE